MKKDLSKIQKLAVFDFDGTLLDTPLPENGMEIYKIKTGHEWPYKGWWGREESLDPTIFDIKPIGSVISDYKKESSDQNTGVIMLTGRITKLADKVKSLLDSNGLTFDGYFYNGGGSTDTEKIKTLNKLLVDYPNIRFIEVWDDRVPHIPIFEQWGKEQCLNGKLDDFKINLVFSNHH